MSYRLSYMCFYQNGNCFRIFEYKKYDSYRAGTILIDIIYFYTFRSSAGVAVRSVLNKCHFAHIYQRIFTNTIETLNTFLHVSLCANKWTRITKVFMKSCSPIARFMEQTWGPSGADRTQVGPMLAPWTLLPGFILACLYIPVLPNCSWIGVNIGISFTRFFTAWPATHSNRFR